MIFESPENWNVKDLEGMLFFVQRLQELSYDQSDFLEKSLSTPAARIVKECLDALDLEEEGIIKGAEAELQILREELKEKIYRDPIAKTLLGDKKERYISILDTGTGKDLRNTLQLMGLKLSADRYWDLLKQQISETVNKPREKDNILLLADTCFEFLTLYGYEKGTVYHLIKSTFFNKKGTKINELSQLETFLEVFDLKKLRFDVYFVCSNLFKEISDSCENFGLELIEDKEPEYNSGLETKFFRNPGNRKSFIKCEGVLALDYLHAMRVASEKVSLISDLFVLFHHKKKPWFSKYCLVYNHNKEQVLRLSSSVNPMSKLNEADIEHAKLFLPVFLKEFSLNPESFKRFTRGVELHALSLETDEVSSQILNLWICLEALLITGKGTHISTVEKSIKLIVSNYYLKERLTNLHDLLHKWNSVKFSEVVEKLPLEWQDDDELSALALVGLKEYESLAMELLAEMGDYPLLRYKFMRLVREYQKPKTLEDLKNHIEKIASYDIRRIYRTRNKIVHQGVLDNKSETIVSVAHYYLDTVMNAIVYNRLVHEDINSIENFLFEQNLFKAEHEQSIAKAKQEGLTPKNIKSVILGPDYK